MAYFKLNAVVSAREIAEPPGGNGIGKAIANRITTKAIRKRISNAFHRFLILGLYHFTHAQVNIRLIAPPFVTLWNPWVPFMPETLTTSFRHLLGLDLDGSDLHAGHMVARVVIVFVLSILFIRIGNKRFMGRNTALDVMLGIVYGSVMSRAITGNAPFVPTVVAGMALVMMHWLLAWLAFSNDGIGAVIKGRSRMLVKKGEILWDEMKKSHISRRDLQEAIRHAGMPTNLDAVHEARLERDGKISVIPTRMVGKRTDDDD